MANTAFEKQVFVSNSSVKYGWDPSRIKTLLEEKYGKQFEPERLDEYDNFLAGIKSKTAIRLSSDQPRIVHIENATCPICGAPIINDDKWFGRLTRTPGWYCTEGKALHFIQWKANNICRNRKQPIPFEEIGDTQNAL